MKHIIDQLRRQKAFHLKSQGSSMLPILQPNDIVYYRKISFPRCSVNDLIMVRKEGNVFTHRVIYKRSVLTKDGSYLITKGDNNLESDGKIFPKQIITKVYQIKRNGQMLNPESIYLFQSTLYFKEIVKVKKKFEREKIDFVFLKGLPLHLYYEKTHPRRLYLDCDVLVHPKDFQKAENILFRSGYKKADTELSEAHQKIKDKEVENAYYKIINGFRVVFDLHLEVVFMMTQLGKLDSLYPQSLIDQLTNEFLATKQTVKILDEPFFILHSLFFILYLSLHFFHHNFRGAFRLQFLDRIIRRLHLRGVIWADLAARMRYYQLQNFVYPVFLLLKKHYQTPIPPSFFKTIQPDFINFMNFIDLKNLSIFNDEPRIKAGINRFKNLFFLSPRPWWRKIIVFFNPQVVYSIAWVVLKKFKSVAV